MYHGDVFAGVRSNVLARVDQVPSRMYFGEKPVLADGALPDPPVVVNYFEGKDR